MIFIKVDFDSMNVIEPYRRPIRRTFHPGFWVLFNQSEHEVQLHLKINDVQVTFYAAVKRFLRRLRFFVH